MSVNNEIAIIANKLKAKSGLSRDLAPLIFITDKNRIIDPVNVIKNFDNDVMVIIRDYELKEREEYARAIAAICNQKNIKYLVANNLELALKIKAYGVHLPEYNIKFCNYIRVHFPHLIITAAIHNNISSAEIISYKPDALLLSPVFVTNSDKSKKSLGVDGFNLILKNFPKLPVYALGGVNVENVGKLVESQAYGIAGIGLFELD